MRPLDEFYAVTPKNASKQDVFSAFNDPPDGLSFPRPKRSNPVQDLICHCRNVCNANGWPDGRGLVNDRSPPFTSMRLDGDESVLRRN